ncbi:MAG: hypothetical protein WKF77_11410 [Planctomycetaceae bacterium]
MRFAIAGNNATALDVLRELAGSTEHSLVRCALSGELAAAVSRASIPVTLAATVEDALLAGDVDAVLVAIDDLDESLRIVRAASQADRHVIVIPPALCSPAYSFELHLILDESQRGIMPLLPRAAIVELPLTAVDLGLDEKATRQLSIEMSLTETSPAELRAAVIRGLDYLSASGFRYTQITALESNAPDGSLLSRLITLSVATTAEKPLPPGTLTIKPSTLVGRECVIHISQNNATHRTVSIAEFANTLDRIVTVCHSRESCGKWMEAFSVTLELAEAVSKSLRRRRTVDVHFDSGSEKGVFKSQMTAMGCGILTFMMLGMVAYLIVAQLVPLPDTVLHILRILWIAPLVLFLIAQALLPLARDRGRRE